MASSTRQMLWNQHEAVVLLSGYLDYLNNKMPRSEAVHQVSVKLRAMAKNRGIPIDDTFRNESGIHFQMASMESAYAGHTVFKQATGLFSQTVSLYQNNRSEYDKKLMEAQWMIEGAKTIEEAFMSWLDEKVSSVQKAELLSVYPEIEKFCLKIHILSSPLFETKELETVKAVQRTATENKFFTVSHKKQMRAIANAAQWYTVFIKEYGDKLDKLLSSSAPVSEPIPVCNPEIAVEEEQDSSVISEINTPAEETRVEDVNVVPTVTVNTNDELLTANNNDNVPKKRSKKSPEVIIRKALRSFESKAYYCEIPYDQLRKRVSSNIDDNTIKQILGGFPWAYYNEKYDFCTYIEEKDVQLLEDPPPKKTHYSSVIIERVTATLKRLGKKDSLGVSLNAILLNLGSQYTAETVSNVLKDLPSAHYNPQRDAWIYDDSNNNFTKNTSYTSVRPETIELVREKLYYLKNTLGQGAPLVFFYKNIPDVPQAEILTVLSLVPWIRLENEKYSLANRENIVCTSKAQLHDYLRFVKGIPDKVCQWYDKCLAMLESYARGSNHYYSVIFSRTRMVTIGAIEEFIHDDKLWDKSQKKIYPSDEVHNSCRQVLEYLCEYMGVSSGMQTTAEEKPAEEKKAAPAVKLATITETRPTAAEKPAKSTQRTPTPNDIPRISGRIILNDSPQTKTVEENFNEIIKHLKEQYTVNLFHCDSRHNGVILVDTTYSVCENGSEIIQFGYQKTQQSSRLYIQLNLRSKAVASLNYSLFDRSVHEPMGDKLYFTDYDKVKDAIDSLCKNIADYYASQRVEEEKQKVTRKLLQISKINDDPDGISVSRILEMLGSKDDKDLVISILDSVTWCTKLSDEVYSFSDHPNIPKAEPDEDTPDPFAIFDDDDDEEDDEPRQIDPEKKEKYIRVLMQRFQSGMQLDAIGYDIFRDTYFDLFDETLEVEDDVLEEELEQCGVYYEYRIYPAEGILDKETSEKLIAYIDRMFASGKNTLYYKAIMADMEDDFAYCYNLVDDKMLYSYLEYILPPDKYFVRWEYLTNERNVKVNHSAEITDFMRSMGKPLSYEEIYAGLPHLTNELIQAEIHSNREIIMDAREHYFHMDIFEISEDELGKISEMIRDDINEEGYCLWPKVFRMLQDTMPLLLENNPGLSQLGFRNALDHLLEARFSFEGNIISTPGDDVDTAEVYRRFARHYGTYTDEELAQFSRDIEAPIYYNAVFDVSCRVNYNLYVPKSEVRFDVEGTDAAISTYLQGDYALIKDIDSFLLFPGTGYDWNSYLLEYYLLRSSREFVLVSNSSFSLNKVAGAVARADSSMTEFVDVCADYLAKSDAELTKTPALNTLVEAGLLGKKVYRELEAVLTKAKQIRNKKG